MSTTVAEDPGVPPQALPVVLGKPPAATRTGEPAGLAAQIAWTFAEWANEPFFALVTRYIFAAYFANTLLEGSLLGPELWGYAKAGGALITALLSPVIGALADSAGPRKAWTFGFTLLCGVSCCLLWFAEPGSPVLPFIALVVLATAGAEFVTVFINSFLGTLASRQRMGVLSAIGFGMSQLAGIVSLLLVLVLFHLEATRLFPVSEDEAARIVGPIAGIWFIVFMLPLVILAPDRPPSGRPFGETYRHGMATVGATLRAIWPFPVDWATRPFGGAAWPIPLALVLVVGALMAKAYLFAGAVTAGLLLAAGVGWLLAGRPVVRAPFRAVRPDPYANNRLFLVSRMLAADGTAAVFLYGGILASRVFDWPGASLLYFGIWCSVFATTGGFSGAWLEKLFGTKRTLAIALWVIAVAWVGIILSDRDRLLHLMPSADTALLGLSLSELAFLLFAAIISFAAGPAISASRALMAKITPETKMTEFFGLYALSGKATNWLGPLAIGIVIGISGSFQIGLLVALVFVLAGLWTLAPVREERTPDLPLATAQG